MVKRRAVTLIELLVVALLLGVVMAGIGQSAISLNKANVFNTAMPVVQDDANRIVNAIATDLRAAPLCTATTGCVTDSAISEATQTAITLYKTAAGVTTRYALSGTKLERFDNGSATPTVTIQDVPNFSIQYVINPDSSYNRLAQPASGDWVNTVTGADRLKISVVRISASVTRNGLAGTYSTTIRLRNSPKRPTAAL